MYIGSNNNNFSIRYYSLIVALLLIVNMSPAQRQMENLGRGVVAIRNEKGNVFVSWRFLGTEPANTAFNVYRSASAKDKMTRLNQRPITDVTHYVDTTANVSSAYSYTVKPVVNGKEQAGGGFLLNPGTDPYFSIPLQTPAGYAPNDGSVGDLDGDGEYEIVLHQAGRGKDNSQAGEYVFAANGNYQLTGAIGTSSTTTDYRYEYLHLTSYAFQGDGSYAIDGNQLKLKRRGVKEPELQRIRFEKVNHGGTGWKDRVHMLKVSTVDGKEYEVCYEKEKG